MKKISNYIILGLIFLSLPHLSSAEDKWEEHKGYHFIIYYKKAPIDFVKSVEDSAERYYDEITQNLGFTRYKSWMWDDRAQIYIYDNGDDYVENGKLAKWSHGSAFPGQKIIRTFPSAHGFFDSTLPHELGHIIFREFIGPKAIVPLWFEEGVAMYQEKAKRWGSNDAVRKAIDNKTFLSLTDLSNLRLTPTSNQDLVELFYAESASAVYFLITEFGEYRFVDLCNKLNDGVSFEKALGDVYIRFQNIEEFNKRWLENLS